jgi:hypothetical protein
MNISDMFEWVFYGVMLTMLGIPAIIQLCYSWRRSSSRGWPTATATIQRGFVGKIWGYGRAAFFRYEFTVQGVQHSGRFAVITSEKRAQELQDKLDGVPVVIRYAPGRPNASLLSDFRDRRFGGSLATQNPYWFLNVSDVEAIQALNLNRR